MTLFASASLTFIPAAANWIAHQPMQPAACCRGRQRPTSPSFCSSILLAYLSICSSAVSAKCGTVRLDVTRSWPAGIWVYPLPLQHPDPNSDAVASPMKGFSSQAGSVHGTAVPGGLPEGSGPSERNQHDRSSSAGAAQPESPNKPAAGSQPSAQPDRADTTAQTERESEGSSSATAADGNFASRPAVGDASSAQTAHATDAAAAAPPVESPFTRRVQQLAADCGRSRTPDGQASADGSPKVDAQSLTAEAPHATAECSASTAASSLIAGPCSAATCSCGGDAATVTDAAPTGATADAGSGESGAAAETQQSVTGTATEADISLQSSPDSQAKPGTWSTEKLPTCVQPRL